MPATTLRVGIDILVACPIEVDGKVPLSERQTVLRRKVTALNPENPDRFDYEEGTLRIDRMGFDWEVAPEVPAAAAPAPERKPRKKRIVTIIETPAEPPRQVIYWSDGAKREGRFLVVKDEFVQVDNGIAIIGLKANECGKCWDFADCHDKSNPLGPGTLKVLGETRMRAEDVAGRIAMSMVNKIAEGGTARTSATMPEAAAVPPASKPPRKPRQKKAPEPEKPRNPIKEARNLLFGAALDKAEAASLTEIDWKNLEFQARAFLGICERRDRDGLANLMNLLFDTAPYWAALSLMETGAGDEGDAI